jgi:hypothetical protein
MSCVVIYQKTCVFLSNQSTPQSPNTKKSKTCIIFFRTCNLGELYFLNDVWKKNKAMRENNYIR